MPQVRQLIGRTLNLHKLSRAAQTMSVLYGNHPVKTFLELQIESQGLKPGGVLMVMGGREAVPSRSYYEFVHGDRRMLPGWCILR